MPRGWGVRSVDNTPEIAPMARQGDVANMNVHDTLPAADGDRTRSALIGAAAAALAGRNRDIPPDFVAQLFGHAVPEDFARYRPEELAGVAEQSWALLQERKPGAPKIRFEPAAAKPGAAVLEIINDDMPFLVDSIVGEISERGLDIRLLVHPVFTVERSETGKLNAFHGAHKGNGRRESFIHIHVDDDGNATARADLVRTLADILAEVRVCVQDWRPMLARLSEVTAELRAAPPPLPADEIAEAIEFLQWIAADNFTLLGARDYAYTDSEQALEPRFDTGLGLLRSPEMRLLLRGDQLVTATPEIREFPNEPKLIIMTKAAQRSRVQETREETDAGAAKEDIAITPLAVPMLAGPGAIDQAAESSEKSTEGELVNKNEASSERFEVHLTASDHFSWLRTRLSILSTGRCVKPIAAPSSSNLRLMITPSSSRFGRFPDPSFSAGSKT
jgi:hypothetical protein